MEHTTATEAVLQPFRTDYLPMPDADEPLFLPADAQRHWYLGYVHVWKEFQHEAIAHWNHDDCKSAFKEMENRHVDEARPVDSETLEDSKGAAKLQDHFQREVLEMVEKIYNTLLATTTMQEALAENIPQGIWIESTAVSADPATKNSRPAFMLRARSANGKDETRLLGHTEYLGGRRGALTLAIKEAARNTWGSLRCVLGDITRWMLACDTKYGFIISSDEIIFLRFDIVKRSIKVNVARKGDPPRFEWVDVMAEPNLFYSPPIKHTDVLDEEKGTVSVKLALLHLIHTTVASEFKMPAEKGNCAKYFPLGNAGEKFRL
ncbi:hypothetical protein ACJQWK_03406 [Exserohilum turcicum]